jgi:hypothetical protein
MAPCNTPAHEIIAIHEVERSAPSGSFSFEYAAGMPRCWWPILLGLASCGPVTTSRDLGEETVDAVVHASGDASRIRALLVGSVANGGLWFGDPACAREFGNASVVDEKKFDRFASCLAGLHLRSSSRKAALVDTEMLAYGPGIEIEARVLDTTGGPVLLWIGFVEPGNPPTIAPEALESVRIAGDPNGPLDPRAAPDIERDRNAPGAWDRHAYAWIDVCLDKDGSVTGLRVREASSPFAAGAFAAAANQWRFRPFIVNGEGMAVCSLVLLAFPPPVAGESFSVPPLGTRRFDRPFLDGTIMSVRRESGDVLIQPSRKVKSAISSAGLRTVVGAFSFCIDATGHVEDVVADRPTGIPSYDHDLIEGIKTWKYRPYLHQGKAIPVCTAATFVYSQE